MRICPQIRNCRLQNIHITEPVIKEAQVETNKNHVLLMCSASHYAKAIKLLYDNPKQNRLKKQKF